MYFLIKASPTKPLDVATFNCIEVKRSHDVAGTGQRFFFVKLTPKSRQYVKLCIFLLMHSLVRANINPG